MPSRSVHRRAATPEVELGVPLYSIRFQISLLLLLSALNAIVVVAYTVALVTSSPGVGGELGPGRASALLGQITPLHHLLVEGEARQEEIEPHLARLGGLLLELDEVGAEPLQALGAYRDAIPPALEALERGEDAPVRRLQASYHRLVGAVHVMEEPDPARNPEARARWLVGVLLLWVVAVAAVTVASSFRLRKVLSQPLSRLSEAAMIVANGELDAVVPTEGLSQELHQLGVALETMRRELVRSIAQLDHQNAVVKAMLDSLGDGVLLLDRSRYVLEYNPAAARHLAGIAPPALSRARRLPVAELLPGLDRELFAGGKGEPARLHYTLEGGVDRYLEVSLQPLQDLGHELERAFVMVVRDVTRSVELDKLQRSFLSVVTHELKTPLTVIEGYVRLLQMGKGGDLSPKQAEILHKVRGQSEILKMMVQDLLDTTRLEGGHLEVEMSELPLVRVAEKVVEALRPEAISRRLALALEVGPGGQDIVRADEFRLEQVVGNLLRNALKFTEAGGRVAVRVRREGERVVMEVEDSGRGIPAAALPRLFEKFYQVELADTRKAGGAGLGLYICDQLVRAMGGAISVRSTVGEGSCFTVALPAVRRPGEPHREEEKSG
jgi:signal transduction histidine kinase